MKELAVSYFLISNGRVSEWDVSNFHIAERKINFMVYIFINIWVLMVAIKAIKQDNFYCSSMSTAFLIMPMFWETDINEKSLSLVFHMLKCENTPSHKMTKFMHLISIVTKQSLFRSNPHITSLRKHRENVRTKRICGIYRVVVCRHSCSMLVQAMTSSPSHCLNHCWLIGFWTIRTNLCDFLKYKTHQRKGICKFHPQNRNYLN